MIANFYKKNGIGVRNCKLIATKNIDCIPQKGTSVIFSGQLFIVDRVYFDLDNHKYDIYIVRA